MRTPSAFWLQLFALGLVGCSSGSAVRAGASGEPCRADVTCDPGLTCWNGTCRSSTSSPGPDGGASDAAITPDSDSGAGPGCELGVENGSAADLRKPDLKLPFAGGVKTTVKAFKGAAGSDPLHGADDYWAIDFEVDGASVTVVSAAAGTVETIVESSECSGGLVVALGNGYAAQYCGLSSTTAGLASGSAVAQGDALGELKGPGAELHFEILYAECAAAAVTRASPEPISGYVELTPGDELVSDNYGPGGSPARSWTFAKNAEGWRHDDGIDHGVNADAMSMDPGRTGKWFSPVLQNVPAADWKAVAVTLACDGSSSQHSTLFFTTDALPDPASDRSLSLPVQCDGTQHVLTFDFSQHPAWKGTITGLRLDPVSDASDDFQVDDKVSMVGAQILACAQGSCGTPSCSCKDADGDGYYPSSCSDPACANTGDCDDGNAAVHPGAQEVCGNGIDEDCSGADLPCGCSCTDADGDGWYPSSCTDVSCAQIGDCNDADATINPGASDVCGNGQDEDCNGADAVCLCGCVDADVDGYYPTTCGDPNCQPVGDCDDTNAAVHPGATDTCGDGVDQNCSGADEVCPCVCADADSDGYYSTSCQALLCTPNGDCNDGNPLIHPGAVDICNNGVDEDCTDGDLICTCTCLDVDGDGYYALSCADPGCSPRTDCDDTNANRHPGAAEICGNGVDEDCNGSDQVCACTCADADGDGYYPTTCTNASCQPKGDCNDQNENVHPGAIEICSNGLDDDCVGGDTPCPCGCTDGDGDGYYSTSCKDPYCSPTTDCDDTSAAVHPGAKEVCGNAIDENCDGIAPVCPGATQWSRRFGDGSAQSPDNVAADPSGNIVVGGYFQGSIDFGGGPLACAGGIDIFLAKFDPTGQHIWSKRYGDAGYEQRALVATDAAGNIYVAGLFTSTIDFGSGTLTGKGVTDIYLAKLDSSGNAIWSKSFGDAGDQRVNALAVNSAGNIAITGMYQGTLNFGGSTLTANSGSSWDFYVASFTSAGTHVFSKSVGDVNEQRGDAIAVDSAGNVICGGAFTGTVDFGAGTLTASDRDTFLVAYQSAGGVLYSKRFGGAGDQMAQSVAVDSSGNVFLGGNMTGSMTIGTTVLTSAGGSDAFLAKLDTGGNVVWVKQFGDAATQSLAGVAVDSMGAVSIAGSMMGSVDFGGGVLTSGGDTDAYFAKLDASGAHVWSKRAGDSASQGGYAVAAAPGGATVGTGFLVGTMDLGPGLMTTAGGYDVFLAKFGP